MPGTLQLNDETAWSPPGWIFNSILERVALRLEGEDVVFANHLFDSLGPTPGYLDLSSVSADKLQQFHHATVEVAQRATDTGPSAFPDAEFYHPFVQELQKLLRQLHADPRLGRFD